LTDTVQAAVQHVYKLPKSSKRRYSVVSLDERRSTCMEDVMISPKSSNLHMLQALDYFHQAELANGRLADFKATESARKAKAKAGRSKSQEPMGSTLSKFRAATQKVVVMNTLRHPMMNAAGFTKADLGKVNNLRERLLRRGSTPDSQSS
jgi:hypothetical protein